MNNTSTVHCFWRMGFLYFGQFVSNILTFSKDTMKFSLTSLCFLFITASSLIHAQSSSTTVMIKIAQKSGFLGMGGPKFATISLSTANRETMLNSINVNSGKYYYFLIENNGKWKLDKDFISDELPKLKIVQESNTITSQYHDEGVVVGDNTSLLVGFPKTFDLHRLFSFIFTMGDSVSRVDVQIPMEYWNGYATISRLVNAADKSFSDKDYRKAIPLYAAVINDVSLKNFPMYKHAVQNRFMSFKNYFTDNWNKFNSILSDASVDIKQKISETEQSVLTFQFCVDSLSAAVALPDSSTEPLYDQITTSLQRSTFVLDSLRTALDIKNTQWIIMGSSGGKIDYRYKYMIETLAYAFISIPFADSTATNLTFTISEEFSLRLKKYNLLESYQTFIRIANDRWKKRQEIYPPDFLPNLKKDSSQFPLPFYSVLKSVSDYFGNRFAESRSEIFKVFAQSYEPEINEKVDNLRILIETREKKISNEVLQHMKSARESELKGNPDDAIEHCKDAMLIAEDYAPAAFALGLLYEKIGDPYKANNFFQKAIISDQFYYLAYRHLYMNYIKNANFKPMIDLLTVALDRGNDFYTIHYYLGYAYNGSGLFEEAIKQFERALVLNNKSVNANIQAGIAYQNMKSYTKAREYYQKAIQIDPENQTATENLKRLDELQKRY
jgi:tetratricopeptide (TPR) repeat protein